MKFWAHRGSHEASGLLENTLPAFELAIAESADGIELDVHLSADGVPVVFHDESLQRLTRSQDQRMIAQVDWSSLRAMPLVNGATMPSLAETLELVAHRLPVNIEIKDPAAVHAVASILERGAFENVLISSFSASAVHEACLRLPQLERAWISGDSATHPVRAYGNWLPATMLLRTGASRWHTHGRYVRPGVVSRLARRGIDTYVWTVNDVAQARCFAGRGVQGVFTDAPGRLRAEFS